MLLDTLYTLYTENLTNVFDLVARYFPAATFYTARGLWQGKLENSLVIEIVASRDDLQSVVHLAGDIREGNAQKSVLVTWASVSVLSIGEV